MSLSHERQLIDELCQIVQSFLCQDGEHVDIERCVAGPHVFAKGGTQAVCTIKLTHGTTYNIEFVYKYWEFKLTSLKFPYSPCFIISNNGLASTLKCFLCEPRDVRAQFGTCHTIDSDVYLEKNTSIILSQDDFVKFKTNLVFTKDLDIFNSMVVCRTYLTDNRQALQFLVLKPKDTKRVTSILGMLTESLDYKPSLYSSTLVARRPIRECRRGKPDTRSKRKYSDTSDSDLCSPSLTTETKPSSLKAAWMELHPMGLATVLFVGLLWLFWFLGIVKFGK